MKYVINFIALLFALAFVAALAYGGYLGVGYLVGQFGVIDESTKAVLSISSVTILLAAFVIGWFIRAAHSRGDKPIHPEKSMVYARFIDAWRGQTNPAVADNILTELRRPMAIWASDGVLKSFYKFCQLLEEGGDTAKVQQQGVKTLMLIRKDLGHDNMGISLFDWPVFLGKTITNPEPDELAD